MIRSLLQPRRLLAAFTLVIFVMACMPNGFVAAVTGGPSNTLRFLIAPVSNGTRYLSLLARPGRAANDMTPEVEALQSQYDQADRRIRELEGELREARERIAQLAGVREIMGGTTVDLPDARVNAAMIDSTASVLRISRGQRAGIHQNMVVASGAHLVGRISAEPGPFSSDVKLITSPHTSLAVRLLPPVPDGMSRETLTTLTVAENRREFTAIVPATQDVRVGDRAYLADDSWPAEARALIVGQVVSVEKEQQDPLLRRRVVVRPVPPLASLANVIVIVPRNMDR